MSSLVVLTTDPALETLLRGAFAPAWTMTSGPDIPSRRADLFVVGADRVGSIARLRSAGGAIGRGAIVVVGDPAGDDAAIDDRLPHPPTRDDIVALAARWTPPATPALDRLSAAFGRAEVVGLATGLCVQLDAAVAALARGQDVDAAHRLAGLSGMLGFAHLGGRWAALSDGEAVDRRALHVATRQAVVALDRFVERAR
ncbi:hypothetical protein ASG29_15215 [Sphingomonas sp. Leaf412]|nr:hypothetical protein ASG29_15215 [Sphingomonas sp. Leaf412]